MDKRKLMPLWDYALMQLPEDEGRRIVRPDNFDMTKVGTLELQIIATGPDCTNLKVGDRMVFNPAACVHFGHEEQRYYLISERACGVVLGEPRRVLQTLAVPTMPA